MMKNNALLSFNKSPREKIAYTAPVVLHSSGVGKPGYPGGLIMIQTLRNPQSGGSNLLQVFLQS
jgi:hypothetical protein